MNNNQLKYGALGVVIGGIVVWLLMTTVTNSYNTGGMMTFKSNSQRTTQSSDMLDVHFIEQMIPHHEDAIIMAKLAQTKAKRPEVKELANNIIDSQEQEIVQMKSWYKDWFGIEVPANTQVMNQHGMMGSNSMHMGMMGDSSDMTRLEQATDFDKTFVEEMIPHHQMAVMMAGMLKGGTNRTEMKKLADDISIAQNKEIELMRSWLTTWSK